MIRLVPNNLVESIFFGHRNCHVETIILVMVKRLCSNFHYQRIVRFNESLDDTKNLLLPSCSQDQGWVMQKSMSLRYEPPSEPLQISWRYFFLYDTRNHWHPRPWMMNNGLSIMIKRWNCWHVRPFLISQRFFWQIEHVPAWNTPPSRPTRTPPSTINNKKWTIPNFQKWQ